MCSKYSLERIAQHSCHIGSAPFLDGVVVHDGRTGRLFQLNHTAAQVWRSLRDGDHEDAIVGTLARTHGIDPSAARGDLAAFAGALQQAGLLGPSEASDEGAELRPPRQRPALDALYRIGEVTVRVICYPAEVAAAFAPLAAPALMPAGTPAEARLALFRARGGFVLTCDERQVERLATAPAARWAMVRQLVSTDRRRPRLALLHAGAVALPAGCLLLCGDSGAGKSSLLAGLVHAGFPFMADDIVPLEEGSGLVRLVRLAISIKDGSWPVIGRLFPELAGAPTIRFGGRTMRYLWPAARAIAPDRVGYPAAAVLFPSYIKDAPLTLTRLDPAHALTLLGEGGSVLPTTDAGLAAFLAWWGELPAYRLSYGRLDDAVAAVRALADGPRSCRTGTAPCARSIACEP
jgi:Coenzyme PQQ synthesis protein D (PqqD)